MRYFMNQYNKGLSGMLGLFSGFSASCVSFASRRVIRQLHSPLLMELSSLKSLDIAIALKHDHQ